MSQAQPAPKQLGLKTRAMQAGLKLSGCPTQPEPILESRAVYPYYRAQLSTHLRLMGKRRGFLINFGRENLKDGISQIVHESQAV